MYVLAACGLAAAAPAGDWPQFRGPGGTAVSPETGVPVKWGPDENVRWKVKLPGRGLSNPVIAGGRVYVTACTGADQDRLHVLCYEEATGKKLWQRQFWATGSTLCNPKTCMAAPTPVTDGKRVYALFATGDLACLDKDGDLVWYRSLVGDYPTVGNNVGMAASPILAKDCLIVPMENVGESFAAGIDRRTGKNHWKVGRARGINWVTPLLLARDGREEVLFQSGGEITAYDAGSGTKRWSYSGSGLSTIPSPVLGDGLVFVPGGRMVALRPGSGKAAPRVVWQKPKLQCAMASPLFYQGRVYAVNSVGVLNCARADTGEVLWQLRLRGPFSASPVAADGKIYLVNEQGTTSVVQAGAAGKLLRTNSLPETILATPTVANGAIYLRSDRHLYCIGGKKK
jgi:outer membrane protein assembly factor BamB